MFMFRQFCDMLISVEEAFPLSISQQSPGMQTVCCPLPLFVALKKCDLWNNIDNYKFQLMFIHVYVQIKAFTCQNVIL